MQVWPNRASPRADMHPQSPAPVVALNKNARFSPAVIISAIYLCVSSAWILHSDRALAALLDDSQTMLRWGVYKGLLFVTLTALLLWSLMQRAFAALERSHQHLQATQQQLLEHQLQLTEVFNTAHDPIIIIDEVGAVVQCNPAAARMFQINIEHARGQLITGLLEYSAPLPDSGICVVKASRGDGGNVMCEASISTIALADQRVRSTLILRDISQRLAHELEIERLRGLHAALGHINQAIVWAQDREQLLQNVCELLVEYSGFKMVWIGWHDLNLEQLQAVARAGDGCEYADEIRVSTRADQPEGNGPSGVAFRENRPSIINNLATESCTQPWQTVMQRHGMQASAAFPICQHGQVCAVLNVYAAQADFFHTEEIALLGEATLDISYALDNLEREKLRKQAQQVAINEKLFSDTMIESMPGVLYFYDADGQFLRWNRNMETASGYSSAEISGMHPLDFFNIEQRTLLSERIADTLRLGESEVEADFLSKDGSTRPYYFTGRRIEFNGRTCLVGVGIDISARKLIENALTHSEQRYRSTLDNILEGCQLLSFEWRYLYLNEAAANHNRRANFDLLGRTLQECWPGIEETLAYRLMKRCMDERVAIHEEIEFVFPDGEIGWFDLRIQAVPEGIFVLSIDISERHDAERALHELNATLENKVILRTAELKDALIRAEAADRLKSAFLATMSHELRTPMNSIIGFTGILLQGLAGPLNPEQDKHLGMVRSSARHLLELINDVLDISKVEAGQLELRIESFAPEPVLRHVLESVAPQAAKKQLSLQLQCDTGDLQLSTDRRRFEQILLNLVNNAIKFTAHGQVTLSSRIIEDYGPMPNGAVQSVVKFSVVDTGIGIQADDLELLFKPFRQIDSGLSRLHEGTGLGLAICQRLADLMGGVITVSSIWLRGSEFALILPLQGASSP